MTFNTPPRLKAIQAKSCSLVSLTANSLEQFLCCAHGDVSDEFDQPFYEIPEEDSDASEDDVCRPRKLAPKRSSSRKRHSRESKKVGKNPRSSPQFLWLDAKPPASLQPGLHFPRSHSTATTASVSNSENSWWTIPSSQTFDSEDYHSLSSAKTERCRNALRRHPC